MAWARSLESKPWSRLAMRSAMDKGTSLDVRLVKGKDATKLNLIGIYAIIYDGVSLNWLILFNY